MFEDATTVSVATRSTLLKSLATYLETLPQKEEKRLIVIKEYAQLLKESLPEFDSYFDVHKHELELLQKSEEVLWEIGKFDLLTRKIFKATLMDMATGMETVIHVDSNQIPSSKELDSYCYTVAGTVGLFLSHVFWDEEAFEVGVTLESLESQGIAFGKALQLVNITKDFHSDWSERRLFWPLDLDSKSVDWTTPPNEATLIETLDTLINLFDSYSSKADQYVSQISSTRPDLVFFCKFPLEMARENIRLAAADRSWLNSGKAPKIPRLWTMKLAQKLGIGSDIMNFFN